MDRSEISPVNRKKRLPVLSWDMLEFVLLLRVIFLCGLVQSVKSIFLILLVEVRKGRWGEVMGFGNGIFCCRSLSLVSSFPVTFLVINGIGYRPLPLILPSLGHRACFYCLIIRLAPWYFFAAFSVFLILLMLVEVVCLQEENYNLLVKKANIL